MLSCGCKGILTGSVFPKLWFWYGFDTILLSFDKEYNVSMGFYYVFKQFLFYYEIVRFKRRKQSNINSDELLAKVKLYSYAEIKHSD